jgi:flagellar hook assembly protein FlgD
VKVFNSAGEQVGVLYSALGLYLAPTGLSVLQGGFMPDSGQQGMLTIQGPGVVLLWDGRNGAGQIVSSGTYYVSVEVLDPFGKTSTWTMPLSVIRTETFATVQVFNSAGELVWSQKSPLTTTAQLSLSSRELLPSTSGSGLKIQYGSGGSDFVYWNGLNNSGVAVSSGAYMIEVTQDNAGSAKNVYTASVMVLQLSDRVFDAIAASANPVPMGVNQVTLSLQGASPGTQSVAGIYNLGGERVGSLFGNASLTWMIPQAFSSGIYLVRVEATNSLGHHRASIFKLAILR